MDPVFALDAQANDLAVLLVVVALAWTSLVLALRGSWWATAIPAVLCALGAYLAGQSDASPGGGADIDGALGLVLLYIGVAWLVVALAVMLLARRFR